MSYSLARCEQIADKHELYQMDKMKLHRFTIERRLIQDERGRGSFYKWELMEGTAHRGLFDYLPDALWTVCEMDENITLPQEIEEVAS